MKRRDLIRKLRDLAKDEGLTYREIEGGRHTKIFVGDRQAVVPRHNEINEYTAQQIIKHLGGGT